MCNFFSFITKGDGKAIYAGVGDRKKCPNSLCDSHSWLAYNKYKKVVGSCDTVNKYEYVNGELIVDQINVADDRRLVEKWIKKFSDSSKFQSMCLALVKWDGYELEYVKNQTPEICLAAVKQDGHALKYVKNQTPEICLAAVKENGFALMYVKKPTPKIIKAAREAK